MKIRGAFDLKGQVGTGSSQKPSGAVRAQCELSLRARLAREFPRAHANAVSAAAIPLREPTPGRRTEDPNAHLLFLQCYFCIAAGLELCAYVGVDFAAENDFFENWSGPSHNVHLWVKDFTRRALSDAA